MVFPISWSQLGQHFTPGKAALMLHSELAEQEEEWVEIITCAEPLLGTSLQTPGAQIPLSWKRLL